MCKPVSDDTANGERDSGRCRDVPSSKMLAALACAFSYPRDGIGDTLAPLQELVQGLGEEESACFDKLFEASRGFADETAEKLAYTRLFIGSFKMEAPPYASFYLSENGTLNGRAAAEVAAVYRQFGLELDDAEHAPADHLRYLIHFLALLAARYEQTGSEAFAEAYRDFRDAYITPWYGSFYALVDDYAEDSYYPELVSLIERML